MNKHIEELWEEATESSWPRAGKFTAGEYDYNLEKFAELIIGECLGIVQQRRFVPDEEEIARDIKEHFGVK